MVSEILQNSGIKPSYHRIEILKYLLAADSHPTVEEIYSELAKVVPTLSKTTVYNTLNLFVEAGLARRINIDDSETRYDAVVATHGHFKCQRCNKIYDFAIDPADIKAPDLAGFEIKEKKVYFQGSCPSCLGLQTKKREEEKK